MGRRNADVEDTHRWVFNRLASFYRYRPAYPSAVVDYLVAVAGDGARVADLGAGTGRLSVPLAERGLHVSAVEPASEMLAELREAVATSRLPIESVHAAAESTGLPAHGCEMVLVADAIQWLDPQRAGAEARRLRTPSGACAVVEIQLRPTPFVQALQARLKAANPKAPPRVGSRLEQFLALAVPHPRHRSIEHFSVIDTLDADQLVGTLRSLSFVGPALGPAALQGLFEDVLEIARVHGGARWPRDITVSVAQPLRATRKLQCPEPLR